MNQLKKRENFEVTLIDPLEYDIPLTETRKFKNYIIKKKKQAFHFLKPDEEKPEKSEKLNGILESCDCYFIVAGEYNNTIQPPLTNLLDHFSPSIFSHKPSGICW